MRAALYLRVSTGEQSVEPQKLELREYCQRRGWTDVREYPDKISGAKFTRLGLDMLMADVRKRRIDAVVCVKLDRLGRSLSHLAQLVGELAANGVALVCPSQGIDTSGNNPAGRLQMHVLMAVAEFERELIRERTRSGLAVARARGATLGRPKFVLSPERRMALEGWLTANPRPTLSTLAKSLGCSVGKAHELASSSGIERGVVHATLVQMKPRQYRYVGPDEIRKRVTPQDPRSRISNLGELRAWLAEAEPNSRRRDYVPATFVIDLSKQLWLADRRSEHVACAAGQNVLSAGELVFCQSGSAIEVIEATNQSTGYCPEPESWDDVSIALDEAGIPHPQGFTIAFQFRRCDGCGSTNLIKDEVFECSVCGAELSSVWNYCGEE